MGEIWNVVPRNVLPKHVIVKTVELVGKSSGLPQPTTSRLAVVSSDQVSHYQIVFGFFWNDTYSFGFCCVFPCQQIAHIPLAC